MQQQEFEVVLVRHEEIPVSARRVFYCTLWNLGLVILSWHEHQPGSRERDLLVAIAGDSYFDDSSNDILKIAETLRFDSAADHTLEA